MLHLRAYPALHPLFESLGYTAGYLLYKRARVRKGDVLDDPQRWAVMAAAAVGALVGSHLLGLLEQCPRITFSFLSLTGLSGGKTIVGGLLGGWLAVEVEKRLSGIRSRTGDLFAIPLCVGIAVGRVGCLLAGPADDTFGKPTGLPWGVDFGDGLARHPTQAYEIVFLTMLALLLDRIREQWQTNGLRFRIFLASYLAWRFLIDFLKPQPLVLGLNLIQWASAAGLLVVAADFLMHRSCRPSLEKPLVGSR